jgi:hypothetical protein
MRLGTILCGPDLINFHLIIISSRIRNYLTRIVHVSNGINREILRWITIVDKLKLSVMCPNQYWRFKLHCGQEKSPRKSPNLTINHHFKPLELLKHK